MPPAYLYRQRWCCIIVSSVYREENRDGALQSPCSKSSQIRYHSTDTDSPWETWKKSLIRSIRPELSQTSMSLCRSMCVFFELQPGLKSTKLECFVLCFQVLLYHPFLKASRGENTLWVRSDQDQERCQRCEWNQFSRFLLSVVSALVCLGVFWLLFLTVDTLRLLLFWTTLALMPHTPWQWLQRLLHVWKRSVLRSHSFQSTGTKEGQTPSWWCEGRPPGFESHGCSPPGKKQTGKESGNNQVQRISYF